MCDIGCILIDKLPKLDTMERLGDSGMQGKNKEIWRERETWRERKGRLDESKCDTCTFRGLNTYLPCL